MMDPARQLAAGLPAVFVLLGSLLVLPGTAAMAQATSSPEPSKGRSPALVVLTGDVSPFRSLAQEIATLESAPLVSSVEDALAARPAFLLWVVSPGELSDAAATTFSLALDAAEPRPAAGLITGTTASSARALYQRGKSAGGEMAAAVLGKDVFTAEAIVVTQADPPRRRPLRRAQDVVDLLRGSDYVHYAGHGGSGYWRPLEQERVVANDISQLAPVVISTMSCQTMRVWEKGSIALRMVDEGAAAYSGFYYSPMAGFQVGESDGPFQHTWPGVPVGMVIEALNAGARKGYARFPFHLLLGDPRIALRPDAPCQLSDLGESDGVRTLACPGAPSGLIPLRVPGGARYSFVEVAGGASHWDRDPFFNTRLQTATVGEDRVVVVAHEGGHLELRLRRRPPFTWLAVTQAGKALDKWLVTMADRRHGGEMMALVPSAIAAVAVALRLRRRRRFTRAHVAAAVSIGLAAGVMHLAYGLLRAGSQTVINKDIVFSPFAALGTGVLACCGAFLFLTARSRLGRLVALLVPAAPGWIGGSIALGMAAVGNVAIASATGTGVWIYRTQVDAFVLAAVVSAACWATFSLAIRIADESPLRRSSDSTTRKASASPPS